MFRWKKNTVNETTQEPSSPKVMCISQVRVKRSKKIKNTTASTTCALDLIEATYEREVNLGEVLVIDKEGNGGIEAINSESD
ncbi:hypothetical protein L2E82_47590 [Cichorium intybus]|uniref:Uncharacterized protein n=1 Tax=Cichorium intybus TaxID=13427 RepID=A0ACB8YVR9_CICIN|nr:hypothetical protein L2E82_47590 [Cichorium intybus]